MDWLEKNLDAYRIVSEMLKQLRSEIRSTLVKIHGADWHRAGLPKRVFDRLVECKEREQSIDWYESEYQELVDFAVFIDFLEILEHQADEFPQFARLAPNSALLHARLLELEVMRTKLGRARPISEAELSFLSTFHLRLRSALTDFHEAPPVAEDPEEEEISIQDEPTEDDAKQKRKAAEQQPVKPPPKEQQPVKPPPPEQQPVKPPRQEQQPVKPPPELDEPEPGESDAEDETDAPEAPPAPEGPPRRGARTPESAQVQPPPDDSAPSATTLGQALEREDTRQILRELYREITTTAESLWSEEHLNPPMVWEKVSVSSWYAANFSKIGLKPVSDFYEVISNVQGQMRDGTSREQIQNALKEYNFAQILLALRDMFQRNNI